MEKHDVNLYNCPFCGGDAHLIVNRAANFDYLAAVGCKECKARTRIIKSPSKENAIGFAVAAWNNRTV